MIRRYTTAEQTAIYLANRLRGADERNAVNRARWNEQCRQRWELEHVSAGRRRSRAS